MIAHAQVIRAGSGEADGDPFMHAIGDELRRVRRERGLSHEQVAARLPYGLSVSALRSYEWGTRVCSATRLHDLCCALGVPVAKLVAVASARVGDPQAYTSLRISVALVIGSSRRELQPLRNWAHVLGDGQVRPAEVMLSAEAIRELAFVCGVDAGVLRAWLDELTFYPAWN